MHIATVLANGFEDSEFKLPYDEFRKAGHNVVVIGAKGGERLSGKSGRVKIKTDIGIDEAKAENFDALFIPGGHSPDALRADPRFVQFVQRFEAKPIFAICHGPQLLITADMVRGRSMTAWRTIQADLRNAGALVEDSEVVVDGNLVTSRQPSDIPVFIERSLYLLRLAPEMHPLV